jgi:hypothetical protein
MPAASLARGLSMPATVAARHARAVPVTTADPVLPPAQVKYDSVHGIWPHEVEAVSATEIRIDSRTVSFSDHKALTDVPWSAKGIEIVVECTGEFLKTEVLKQYMDVCGVKRVVVSAPVKEPSVREDGREGGALLCSNHALPPIGITRSSTLLKYLTPSAGPTVAPFCSPLVIFLRHHSPLSHPLVSLHHCVLSPLPPLRSSPLPPLRCSTWSWV